MVLSSMKILFATANNQKEIRNRYVYLDNDFVSFLYQNYESITEIESIFSECHLWVDPLTKFEFLRGIYVPREKELMTRFINSFEEPINHNDIFVKMRENALNLSLIYSHRGRTKGVSTVDLLLAGRLMYQQNFKPLLVTGNKKDFPSFIFDLVGVINNEDKNTGNINSFSILEFNSDKYKNCLEDLKKIN